MKLSGPRASLLCAVVLLALGGVPARAETVVSSGQQAFHGVRVAGANPDKAPATVPAAYLGPPLVLETTAVGRDAAEPTIGIDPKGAAFYAASGFDGLLPGFAKTILLRSRDNGRTWQSVQPAIADRDPLVADLDPYVYVEPDGGRVFGVTLAGAGSFLSYSDDQGESYSFSVLTSPGVNDHQTLFAAPPPEGTSIRPLDPAFPKLLYYCVNHASDVRCARSDDGGATFVPGTASAYVGAGPVQQFIDGQDNAHGEDELVCSGLTGHLAADANGAIYLPSGHCGWPDLAISRDGGDSWTRVRISSEIPAAGVQTAVAVDAADNVYYAWWDRDHQLPYLSVSRDHGATWSTPLMVAPPGVRAVNFPALTAGEEGRIALTFPGSTAKDSAERPWNTYVVISTNALDADPEFLSAVANDPADPIHRGACLGRCGGMFDFLDVEAARTDGAVWATAVDTCTAASKCTAAKSPGPASSSVGLVVREASGPRLFGPLAAPVPRAGDLRLRCGSRSGRRARCTAALPALPAGATVGIVLRRGGVTARGRGTAANGRARIVLRAARALRAGRYRATVTLTAAGTRTTARRSLTLR